MNSNIPLPLEGQMQTAVSLLEKKFLSNQIQYTTRAGEGGGTFTADPTAGEGNMALFNNWS